MADNRMLSAPLRSIESHKVKRRHILKVGTDNESPFEDSLGVLHALARHMETGRRIDTDDIDDERLFSGRKNEIVAKMELVVDENFGGDAKAFRMQMLMQIAKATLEGDNPVLALENWFDLELKESAKLYK
jgi:hypothetical protein